MPRTIRLLPLLLLPLIAACDTGLAIPGIVIPGVTPAAEPVPELPPQLPVAVQAALPPGTPPTSVMQNADGCYLFSIERTEPPSGFPVRDAAGTPICAAPV